MKRYKDIQLESNIHEEEAVELPPRKQVHPSEKWKWTKIFYRSLIIIFSTMVTSLLVWGFLFYS